MHRPHKHLKPPFRTLDEVVHHQMDGVLFMLGVHVDITAFFNSVCKAERPFIPRLKTGGFLAHFL
jgi:hypothetical protein